MAKGRKRKYPLPTTVAQKLLLDMQRQGDPEACTPEQLAELLDRPFLHMPGGERLPVRDVSVAELDISDRAANTFRRLRIHTIGRLVSTPFIKLLSQWNFGVVSLESAQQELYRILFVGSGPHEHVGVDFSSFDRMVRSFIRTCIERERMQSILIGRLGLPDGRRESLAALGARYGISRERVRQLAEIGMALLARPPRLRKLTPFWREVWEALNPPGRTRAVSALARDLQDRLDWAETPPTGSVGLLLPLHAKVRVDSRMRATVRP